MAFETGTATDHEDLWEKLITFLTTNAELVYDEQAWTVGWASPTGGENETDIVLVGPGLSGTDQVFVAMRRNDNVLNDSAEIRILGATGIIPSAQAFDEHVNQTPHAARMFLRANSMDYWFSANGRRFMVVVQVSTVYEAAYAGLFLPYSEPANYPYPLFIGGSAGQGGVTEAADWRSTASEHSHFGYANYSSSVASGYEPSAWMLSPSGEWLRCSVNDTSTNVAIGPSQFNTGFGISANAGLDNWGFDDIRQRIGAAFGGDFLLTPFTLAQTSPSDQTFGILDGAYHVPGRGVTAEDTVTVGGVDHLVVQNVFRTSLGAYWAMQLGSA